MNQSPLCYQSQTTTTELEKAMKTNFLKINRPARPRIIEVGGPVIGQVGRSIYRMRTR